MNLSIDLQRGVVPISAAASSLARLLRRCAVTGRPVIVTQKGYPTAVLLDIDTWQALRALIAAQDGEEVEG